MYVHSEDLGFYFLVEPIQDHKASRDLKCIRKYLWIHFCLCPGDYVFASMRQFADRKTQKVTKKLCFSLKHKNLWHKCEDMTEFSMAYLDQLILSDFKLLL